MRNPWLMMLLVTLAAALLAAYPLPVLAVAGLVAGCWGVTTWHDKRHVTHTRLRQRADCEHRLVMRGDPRGTYGRFPPAAPHNEMTRPEERNDHRRP